MLVKILDADEVFVEKLKALTGEGTASKAFLKSALMFDFYLQKTGDLTDQVCRLQDEARRLKQIISGARSAAALLLEKTGQEDLFDEHS